MEEGPGPMAPPKTAVLGPTIRQGFVLLATWNSGQRKGGGQCQIHPLAFCPQMVPSSPSASVVVAVRVRPFSQREKDRNAQLIVEMPDERVTELRDPKGLDGCRQFVFDHSYWSHDGFRVLQNGYLAPGGRKYADQKRVFEDLGGQILGNAWAGYNCTLFAYGQTGSGKSYSIIGFGQNRGIVPQLCEELFRGIREARVKNGANANFQVSISMLEIYCEKVRDLLGEKAPLKEALRMREHPREGFYVEGLSNWPVDSYGEMERRIAQGKRQRSIAATNMNETSSRAHTIVRLIFNQKLGNGATKSSEINLVDLAGSERQKKAGIGGGNAERQKEGIRINLSLSTLGRVIQALHEGQQRRRLPNSNGAADTTPSQIPYRDSVLTALLRNALGGNSKTIMIAAISPADIHYEESLSTLRFADRVKKIKTRPVVNEARAGKMMRALREENGRMLEMLHKAGQLDGVATQEELDAVRRQLAQNQREMERLERSWTQREEALKKQMSNLSTGMGEEERMEQRRKECPHFWNLNEDPALTNLIVHFVEKGENRVGNGAILESKGKPQILLNGLCIQPKHALVRNRENNKKVTICPVNGAELLLNGRPIREETELSQNDRVHFGGNHLYVFVNPTKKGALPADKISFEMAQKEIAKAGHLVENNNGNKSKEDQILEDELVNLVPFVYRANSMAKELEKNVCFEIVLMPPESRGGMSNGIWVKVQDREEKATHFWDESRFLSRYSGMEEMYQNWVESGEKRDQQPEDPFHESANIAMPLGTATLFLQNLAYLVEMDEQIPIIDVEGIVAGHLFVSLRPCSVSGRDIVGECVERSEELIGRDLGIKVKLLSANGLPTWVEQSFCKYRFFDQEPTTSNPAQPGTNPVYAHENTFLFRPVTQQLIDYLTESALIIEVSAIQRSRLQQKKEKMGKNNEKHNWSGGRGIYTKSVINEANVNLKRNPAVAGKTHQQRPFVGMGERRRGSREESLPSTQKSQHTGKKPSNEWTKKNSGILPIKHPREANRMKKTPMLN